MLTSSGRISLLVSGILVDQDLPKFVRIREEKEKRISEKERRFNEWEEDGGDIDMTTVEELSSENWKLSKEMDYEYMKEADTKELNVYVSDDLFKRILSPYSRYEANDFISELEPSRPESKTKRFFRHLSEKIKSSFAQNIIEIDVLEFFREVKGITKENSEIYKNRLNGYIIALKNTDLSGQKALKEKLLCNFVINKYESVLYANDLFHVITEDQLIEFYKKTEKGVTLTYMKNYTGIIPSEVCKKINEINEFEIFDNYVILHYDPQKKSYKQTIEEKQKEVAKRKDPILFGVIKGSNKLYYITDWIDEFCDLTLDKFAETIQVDKDLLKLPDTLNTLDK